MEKSSARNEVSKTSPLRPSGAHKKTAEELVDEMFDSVSFLALAYHRNVDRTINASSLQVWLPKAGAPHNGKDEGNFGERNDRETQDYDEESMEDESMQEESMQEESMEDEFESVETGVQNAVAGLCRKEDVSLDANDLPQHASYV